MGAAQGAQPAVSGGSDGTAGEPPRKGAEQRRIPDEHELAVANCKIKTPANPAGVFIHPKIPQYACNGSIGSLTWKHVAPGFDSTLMNPRCCRTIRCAVSSPSPSPWPGGFVVKNGSKMRA